IMAQQSEPQCSRGLQPAVKAGIRALLQRIGIVVRSIHSFHIVERCRIGPSSLSEGLLRDPPSGEQPRHTEVSIMAARLVIDPVRLIVLPGIFLLDRPWFRPCGRIFYGDAVLERVGTGERPALDQMAVLA